MVSNMQHCVSLDKGAEWSLYPTRCACVRERKRGMNRLYLPKPDDLFAVPCVMTVHSVPLPVLQVYLLHATEHHLDQTKKIHKGSVMRVLG